MIQLAICTEPEDFVKERHICYYAETKSEQIELLEVVECFYKHPQAPDDAIIPVIETRMVARMHRNDFEAGSSVLLEANQKAVHLQFRRKS